MTRRRGWEDRRAAFSSGTEESTGGERRGRVARGMREGRASLGGPGGEGPLGDEPAPELWMEAGEAVRLLLAGTGRNGDARSGEGAPVDTGRCGEGWSRRPSRMIRGERGTGRGSCVESTPSRMSGTGDCRVEPGREGWEPRLPERDRTALDNGLESTVGGDFRGDPSMEEISSTVRPRSAKLRFAEEKEQDQVHQRKRKVTGQEA